MRDFTKEPFKTFQECADFLKENKKDLLIFITAKNNIGKNLTEEDAKLLIELGVNIDISNKALNGKMWRGFIAILDMDELAYLELAENKKDTKYTYKEYNIFSPCYKNNKCDDAIASKKDFNYCANKRGINITVFNHDGKFINSSNYDTHEEKPAFSDVTQNIEEQYRLFEIVERYKNKEFELVKPPKLKLSLPNAPWGETAIIFGCERTGMQLNDFAKENSLNLSTLKNGYILSTGKAHKQKALTYVFNGMTFARNEDKERVLLVGEDEVADKVADINTLRNECGEFELLIANSESVELSKDYFGLSSWFYYHKDNVFAASTSFHLLVLMLVRAGIKLELDEDVIGNYLSCANWVTAHLYSYDTFIKGIEYSAVDKNIKYYYNAHKLIFLDTPFTDEQKDKDAWDEELYKEYILGAKEELIENMTAIFKHRLFANVIVDATDGIDTRVNIATVANIDQKLKNKARFYSIKKDNQTVFLGINYAEDFKTACGLSNLLNIPFVDINTQKRVLKKPKWDSSFYLGNNFMSGRTDKAFTETVYPNAIRLNGGNGESGIGTFSAGRDSYNNLSEKKVKNFFNKEQDFNRFYKATAISENHKKHLCTILETLPSTQLHNQIDLLYTHFRNPFHFKNKYAPQLSFSPIQSLFAYRAKKLMQVKEKLPFYTAQLDLIAAISPEVAAFPYVSKKQNGRLKVAEQNRFFKTDKVLTDLDFSEDGYKSSIAKIKNQYLPNETEFNKQLKELKEKELENNAISNFYENDNLIFCLLSEASKIPSIDKIQLELLNVIFKKNNPTKKRSIYKLLDIYYLKDIIKE